MPELAEVEFYRRQWERGLRSRVLSLELNVGNRVFRGTDTDALQQRLAGARLLAAQAHGKQTLFRFSKNLWLGIHLGMTGKLQAEAWPCTGRTRHDHLILNQSRQRLVFRDPRQFGRVRFHVGKDAPPWWTNLPCGLLSDQFTFQRLDGFLTRHGRAPIKAVLLLQSGFPGIGNWMADEILWQAFINPARRAGQLRRPEKRQLHRTIVSVCDQALRTIPDQTHTYGEPPPGWLFHRRWQRGGNCPKDGAPLRHAPIGGRTTCWCPRCQKQTRSQRKMT